MTDPVIEGLADGLKPTATVAADDLASPQLIQLLGLAKEASKAVKNSTVPVRDLTFMAIDAKLGRLERLQERAVEAAERQATALEALAALLVSCTGVGTARCYAEGEPMGSREVPLNYLRSGNGAMPFACDADKLGDDDE